MQLKRWGMFNILGKELTGNAEDENLRPWFYTWSIMTRYFSNEMKIIKVDDLNIQNVRTTAGLSGSGDITIAIVNNGDKEANFIIDTQKIKKGKRLNQYLYTENNRQVNEQGFPFPLKEKINSKNGIQVSIPAKSVILYTSYKK